jgi:hypothetical protein
MFSEHQQHDLSVRLSIPRLPMDARCSCVHHPPTAFVKACSSLRVPVRSHSTAEATPSPSTEQQVHLVIDFEVRRLRALAEVGHGVSRLTESRPGAATDVHSRMAVLPRIAGEASNLVLDATEHHVDRFD